MYSFDLTKVDKLARMWQGLLINMINIVINMQIEERVNILFV